VSPGDVIERLGRLVACDTQNPPREVSADSGVFAVCADLLPDGFEVKTWDHGDGHISWYARRGNPSILFNAHLDTVPIGKGWTSDPLSLEVRDGRAYGRGACDIKGAAAVLLSLAAAGAEDLALLFTSDEEGGGGCCVARFLAAGEAERYAQVIVAEPTGCRAVLSHRGFLSVQTRFFGTPGHSSEARALHDNANHQMANWAAAAVEVARGLKSSEEDPGSCLNIGIVNGGTKSNVIADEAFVHWSARLPPGSSSAEFLRAVQACAPAHARVQWEVPFDGAPLPAEGGDTKQARAFCAVHGLEIADPVDFWTEASLFSSAGLPVLVLGPGDIRQAHVADEWVAVDQLERAVEAYGKLVLNDG
jgi:acetylornithine deacetylase